MCDEVHYYKDRVKELESINNFIKDNTLSRVIAKLEWLKEGNATMDHAIHAIKAMK
jgi:hypothetical protein